MKKIPWIVMGYGALIVIGGVIGAVVAKSSASLAAGLISGFALIAGASLLFKGKASGLYLSLFITFLLDGFFSYRFLLTKAWMPSGVMSILSLGVLFVLTFSLRKVLNKKVAN